MGEGHGEKAAVGSGTAAARHSGGLKWALAMTSTFMVVEVVGGLWTGSLALLADAAHMLTDVGGMLLALVAIRFAARPATPEKLSVMCGWRCSRRWPMRLCCCS